LFAIAITAITVRLLWARYSLRPHPHVEPVEIAKPEISNALHRLVNNIADIADVAPPPIYIRRAALPNAFIVAGIFRPELFLTDELLEQCDNLEELERIICHEIAHIQHADALPLGLLTLGLQYCQPFPLPFLTNYFQRHINQIEQAANKQAEHLFNNIDNSKP